MGVFRRRYTARHRSAAEAVRWKAPLFGVALMLVVTAIPAVAVVFLAHSATAPASRGAAASGQTTAAAPPRAATTRAPGSAAPAPRGAALRAGTEGRDAAPARISGRVLGGGGDGTPLAGVRVTAYAVTGGAAGSAITSSSGAYSFSIPGAATYLLCADASGAAIGGFASDCSQPVSAPDGGSREVGLFLPGITGPGPCEPGDFVDVQRGDPFCPDISWLAGADLTRGADTARFDPAGTVTRGQMALFLYRLRHPGAHPDPACGSAPFPDVPSGAPSCGAIAWLVDAGVTNGVADGSRFDPAGMVTRGQMALFLDRLQGSPVTTGRGCAAAPFPDIAPKDAICGAVVRLVQAGVTAGNVDGGFAPGDPVTRGQMAAFLHRLANPTRITGTVTAGDGTGLPGVSVIITGMGDTHAAYSTVTRTGGVYTVPIVAPGTYQVCFDAAGVAPGAGRPKSGYAFQCFDDVPAAGLPSPVAVAQGEATTVDAVLVPPSA